MHIPPNAELTTVVSSPDFIHFTERIKRDHQIAISPSAKFGQGDEAVFKLRCQRSNVDFLSTARDALEEFLGQRNVSLPLDIPVRGATPLTVRRSRSTRLMRTKGSIRSPMPFCSSTASCYRPVVTLQPRRVSPSTRRAMIPSLMYCSCRWRGQRKRRYFPSPRCESIVRKTGLLRHPRTAR